MIDCLKMNGNGNDFLVMDNLSLAMDASTLARTARAVCRRRESVGADGLLVLEPSERTAFRMRLFNRDGSEGEMCGNGARCAARFAFERGITGREMTFETLGGDVNAAVRGDRVALDLAPVNTASAVLRAHASVEGCDLTYSFLVVGVPHVVIFEQERRRSIAEYALLGRAIRNRRDLFPEGTNVNFAHLLAGVLDVITYERGVEDITLSCGTGSVASAIVGRLMKVVGDEVRVLNPGGVNDVSLTWVGADVVQPRLEGGALMIAEVRLLPEAFDAGCWRPALPKKYA